MNEFDMIKTYFLPLAMGQKEALGYSNDGAVLKVPTGKELVVTSDTLNAGTHFLDNMRPQEIARKALRVNLSDLASMGAKPYAYQLCIAFPEKPKEAWVKAFTDALLEDQKHYGLFCSGGDTTSTLGPLSISITAFGLTPSGKSLKRSSAKSGDDIVITGIVGDALIGLYVLQDKLGVTSGKMQFAKAYKEPSPRSLHYKVIRKYARAAADISDGLIADLGHIAKASNCGMAIEFKEWPFSKPAQTLIKQGKIMPAQLLSGGDDYELALAVPPEHTRKLFKALRKEGLTPFHIGKFVSASNGIIITDSQGSMVEMSQTGWTHF